MDRIISYLRILAHCTRRLEPSIQRYCILNSEC